MTVDALTTFHRSIVLLRFQARTSTKCFERDIHIDSDDHVLLATGGVGVQVGELLRRVRAVEEQTQCSPFDVSLFSPHAGEKELAWVARCIERVGEWLPAVHARLN